MSINVVRFKAEHLEAIVDQPAQAYLRPFLTSEHIKALEQSEHSFTGISGERPIICAGVVSYWPGRGHAWAYLDANCKREFIGVHNVVKSFLEDSSIKRIEATVDCAFEAGHRWMRLLGFELEATRMKAYTPNGVDYSLYARVR